MKKAGCDVKGCGNVRKAYGLCSRHYRDGLRTWQGPRQQCVVEGCVAELRRGNRTGYCGEHNFCHPQTRQKMNEASNARYASEPARRNEAVRRSREKNPALKTAARHKRRTRLRGKPGFTAKEWRSLLAEFGHCCAACGATNLIEVDHIVPISRGGENTVANLQPLCRRCNRHKGTNTARYLPWPRGLVPEMHGNDPLEKIPAVPVADVAG